MPGMDGLELIRTLKEKNCPGEILVLSNYEDFDSVRSALLLGAADYLLKIKIQPDTLLACLNKTVEKLKDRAPRHLGKLKKRIRKRIYQSCCWDFFQKDVKLSDFMRQHAKTRLAFMEDFLCRLLCNL